MFGYRGRIVIGARIALDGVWRNWGGGGGEEGHAMKQRSDSLIGSLGSCFL
jgi:hypothetical protein